MKPKSKEECALLLKIKQDDNVKECIPKVKDNQKQIQVKPICLLTGYMYNLLTEEDMQVGTIKDDLEKILKTIPSYFDILLTQTMMLAQMFKMGRSPKRITARSILTLIRFS